MADVKVEQVDRDAAASLLRFRGEGEIYCASVERGEQDDGDAVQNFARHRLAALATGRDDKLAGDELNAASFARLWSNYCDVKSERDDLRERLSALATGRDDKLAGALVSEFLPAILHGDELHQAWLTAAVHAFIDGEPIPEPVGKGAAALRASTDERNAVIEECAKLVEAALREAEDSWQDGWNAAIECAADDLRAIKGEPDA